ncbi:hypothetical protein AXG93_3873s1130 [Marchantia polymorpha subsp. ruderalis]|uniref:Uncharacterized protein n=1 Tax=Marchantia polymorpha subsp. ruderalis TaxID=1480154 RepID=A0A176VKS6_MARPO|nr:hypothetical protein AXG93_3873s1130 [Marchantia polymorpha subsp. ruderalis]
MTAREARLDITVHGYTLKAHLTKNVVWDAKRSERGPEGWAKFLPLPTHCSRCLPDVAQEIVGSIAYYKLGGVKTPYVGAMGYRSQAFSFDIGAGDIGTRFTDVRMSYRDDDFMVTGLSAFHTIKIHAKADFETFSEPILAPVTKVKWDFACRETFFATVSVEVFERGYWGLIGDRKLVERRTFDNAALEFGGDLWKT